MDLITKIKQALSAELATPIFDIHYDNQKNIVGYVSSELFEEKDEIESQKIIWEILKKYIGQEDLVKILALFSETPRERGNRLLASSNKTTLRSNFWSHETPDLSKFWLFIDVAKIGEEFKSFFLIINQKYEYKNGLTFSYPKDVIEFMELAQNEIYDELYFNTFNNAESEIKGQIMNRHERFTEKGLWGKANMYNYVFEGFDLKPQNKSNLLFTNAEIQMLNDALIHYEVFSIINDIKTAIVNSQKFNALKESYS